MLAFLLTDDMMQRTTRLNSLLKCLCICVRVRACICMPNVLVHVCHVCKNKNYSRLIEEVIEG